MVSPPSHNIFADITGEFGANAKPLYNGNISSMAVNIPKLGNALVYAYTYDQLNRITAMDAWGGLNNANNQFTPVSLNGAYQERITYDPNGNIPTYKRNGDKAGAQQRMDELTYNYKNNNNQLKRVRDAAADGNYSEDIDDQPADNYDYDAIGNLIQNTKEGITKINWTVYGKIESIEKSDGTTINYSYDAAGNRINKTVTKAGATNTTVYVRDAQGNVMSIYTTDASINSGHFTQSELHLYGSSRLGIYDVNKDLTVTSAAPVNMGSGNSGILSIFERGKKIFELANHLGNVLATISDKKLGHNAGNGTIDYYTADIVSAQDYYPGGMQMPGRNYSPATGYRYGFNGKEKDKEAVQYDYGFRIYDPRLIRFKSIDPLTKKYPQLTPYQFASNSPIQAIDLDGLEAAITTFTYATQKDAKVKVVHANLVVDNSKPRSETIMMKIDGKLYTANSYHTLEGRDDKNKFNGDFSNIRTLSNEDLAGIFGYADAVFNVIYQKNTKEHAVLYESGAGPLKNESGLLDFKNSLYSLFKFKRDELIAIDGVAYNANEAGNYLWGMVLREAGIMMNPKTIAELGTSGRNDEPHEQKAIQAGINKADSYKFHDKARNLRNKAFEYYRDEYFEYQKNTGDEEIYTPSDYLGIFKEGREKYGYE